LSTSIRITIVVGTRPEAIKMAPVYLTLRSSPGMSVRLLSTAQHRQMLDQVLSVFQIEADDDLDLMRPNQSLAEVGAGVLTGVGTVLRRTRPHAVLVHGDTSTCLYAALAAFYERIPVGHVEAGLRTYDFDAPWPEEMNRRLVDPICRWCFAPTQRAAENLRAERIPSGRVHITGNTITDALLLARERVRLQPPSIPGLGESALDGKRMILVTGHRRESFGAPFEEFCLALRDIVEMHADTVIVYPVHLNPNVQEPVRRLLAGQPRMHLIDPVEYLPFVHLMDRSYLIITDSGGVQEEAPSLGRPVLVTREVTERPEAVESGLAKLVGTSRDKIVTEVSRLLSDPGAYASMARGDNPYGDGKASQRIADVLSRCLADHP
jgi:UDP-N-acetylglucosamine 2-epimerase